MGNFKKKVCFRPAHFRKSSLSVFQAIEEKKERANLMRRQEN